MKLFYCIRHKKNHTSMHGWRNSGGGWYCVDKPIKYEFVPQSIKDARVQYRDDMEPPYGKHGDFNKRFAELYPKQVKKMLKRGDITQKEVDTAKYVTR